MAELRDESDFVSGLPILVDEKRLIEIRNVLVVPGLVVVLVANLSALLVEGGLRGHAEVHSFDSVGLLVVPKYIKSLTNFMGKTYLVTTVQPTIAAVIASCQSPPLFSAWSRSVEM